MGCVSSIPHEEGMYISVVSFVWPDERSGLRNGKCRYRAVLTNQTTWNRLL